MSRATGTRKEYLNKIILDGKKDLEKMSEYRANRRSKIGTNFWAKTI